MRTPQQQGLTLVELMVVVAIVIVLTAVAIVALRSSSHGSGPLGFSREIAAEIEDMRLRAINTRRWQRLVFQADEVVNHEESTSFGMGDPLAWRTVRILTPNQGTVVCGFENAIRIDPSGTSCNGADTGTLLFAPDGSVRDPSDNELLTNGITIYVRNPEGPQEYRVTLFATTGMATLFEGH